MIEPGQDTTDHLGILLVASCPLPPVIATAASPETQLKIKNAEELPLKPGRLYLCWEGESERGDEAGVAARPLVSAIAQMAAGQCWGKYLIPIPSTWKSSDVSSRLHFVLDRAGGLSCITSRDVMQVASEEALHRTANGFRF